MKRIALFSLIISGSLLAQETNVTELRKSAQTLHQEYLAQKQKAQEWAAQNGYNLANYNGEVLVNKDGRPMFLNVTSADQKETTNTDLLHNNTIPGVAVTGTGMQIFQWDGGRVRTTHQEFDIRVTNLEPSTVSLSNHATAVAGMLIGNGTNPASIGMAMDAELRAYDFDDNFSEMATESANNTDYMISNHSYGYQAGWRRGPDYGEGANQWYWFGYPSVSDEESILHGYYSTLDSIQDKIALDAPKHLMFQSAGNDRNTGPAPGTTHWALNDNNEWVSSTTTRPVNCGFTGFDCIPYGAMAKNIVLVGNINAIGARYASPSDVVAYTSSSFGPTDDGRIKPDLVAVGANVVGPRANSDTGYASGSGTSNSSPNTAGTAILLQEIYHNQNAAYMYADMLKALLLHTTQEAGNNPGPDYQFGWGLLDALGAAQVLVDTESNQAIMLRNTLNNGDTYSLDLEVLDTNQPIKATIVWHDPAVSPSAFTLNNRESKLVNDLDLRITTLDASQTFFPWKLDPDNPAAAATQADNSLDNVEQILIENPSANNLSLNVSHKGTLDASQDFALIVTNAIPANLSTQDLLDNQAQIKLHIDQSNKQLLLETATDVNNKTALIFDFNGKLISEAKLNHHVGNQFKADLSTLKTGIYILNISTEKGNINHKFIVR